MSLPIFSHGKCGTSCDVHLKYNLAILLVQLSDFLKISSSVTWRSFLILQYWITFAGILLLRLGQPFLINFLTDGKTSSVLVAISTSFNFSGVPNKFEYTIWNILYWFSCDKPNVTSYLISGGGVVFAGGREMKIFITVFRDFGKTMVGKRYFQH